MPLAVAAMIGFAPPALAQTTDPTANQATSEQAIEAARKTYGPPPPMEDCSKDQEAAILSGEIIVCRRIKDQSEFRTMSREEAQNRYAEETMDKGTLATPDVAGAGIFRGPATASGMCFVPPCPKPPVYLIDFSKLPEAPPGSDADRMARGLPPLGKDGEKTDEPARQSDEEGARPQDSAEPRDSANPQSSAEPQASESGADDQS